MPGLTENSRIVCTAGPGVGICADGDERERPRLLFQVLYVVDVVLDPLLLQPLLWRCPLGLTSIAGIVLTVCSSVNRAMGLVLVLSWDRPARKKFNLATSVGSPGAALLPILRAAYRHPVVLP